jgi:hypothetical protein
MNVRAFQGFRAHCPTSSHHPSPPINISTMQAGQTPVFVMSMYSACLKSSTEHDVPQTLHLRGSQEGKPRSPTSLLQKYVQPVKIRLIHVYLSSRQSLMWSERALAQKPCSRWSSIQWAAYCTSLCIPAITHLSIVQRRLTNDGNAILREIDVAHPAAKNMIELSRTQDEECGDGTTSVIILGPFSI